MENKKMEELVTEVQKTVVEGLGVTGADDLLNLYTRCILRTMDMIDTQVGRDVSLEVMDRVIENFKMSQSTIARKGDVARPAAESNHPIKVVDTSTAAEGRPVSSPEV